MFVIFVFAALWFTNQFEQKEKQLSWNTFEKLIVSEDVTEVVVRQNKNVPTGRLEIQVGDAKNGRGAVICMYRMSMRFRII